MSSEGCLYVVATPIGNLGDMTPRAVETLNHVEIIAAEDTRHSGRLLEHFNIQTPMVSFHDHNEDRRADELMHRLTQGQSVALICDAGTPLISDPGYTLVQRAQSHAIRVCPIPGATAVISALSVSGLPTDRFVFEGFLPAKTAALQQRLDALRSETRTLVFYVSRHQAARVLAQCVQTFGGDRPGLLAKELTKLHETLVRATLEQLQAWWAERVERQKGELVLVVGGASDTVTTDDDLQRTVSVLCEHLGAKQAAQIAANLTGRRRNEAYRLALKLKNPLS
ncbi:MAG: 16S rRNA (cytidine(1402)-2'-O)-methyltransferase [Pseudomonadota bacterium]